MADTLKCACPKCGAKYRLPIEAQGRTARCKRCGDKFQVPRVQSLEDTILSWLMEPEEEEAPPPPKVITMPKEEVDPEAAKRLRGPIRLKGENPPETDAKTAKTK